MTARAQSRPCTHTTHTHIYTHTHTTLGVRAAPPMTSKAQSKSITRLLSIRFRISRTYKDTHTQHTHTQHTHTTHTHIHNDPVDEHNDIVVNDFQNLAHLQERERERMTHTTHTCACEMIFFWV